jgi:hypothetical protein
VNVIADGGGQAFDPAVVGLFGRGLTARRTRGASPEGPPVLRHT